LSFEEPVTVSACSSTKGLAEFTNVRAHYGGLLYLRQYIRPFIPSPA
jgi:hypothetical protein